MNALKSWSWTSLSDWRSCPKKYYHLRVARDVPQEETEDMKEGQTLHKLMEQRVKSGKQLPLMYQRYDKWVTEIDTLRKGGAEIMVEQKLAFDRDFIPSPWKDRATWFRGVLDVLAIMPEQKIAAVWDWKTGKVKDNHQQLALHAQTVMVHYPEIERVSVSYIWLSKDARGGPKVYDQKELTGMWNVLWPELKMLDAAHRTTTFPARPGALCGWCPVTSCPHWVRRESY